MSQNRLDNTRDFRALGERYNRIFKKIHVFFRNQKPILLAALSGGGFLLSITSSLIFGVSISFASFFCSISLIVLSIETNLSGGDG